jgi:hypothetical protein
MKYGLRVLSRLAKDHRFAILQPEPTDVQGKEGDK